MVQYRRQRAAAVIIDVEKQAVALIERHWEMRNPPHYFVFPGGAVEIGETPEAAVVREVKEELGLDVRPVRVIARVEFPDPTLGPSLQHFFLAEVTGGAFGSGEFGPESK